ncbi:MAG: hypothetical protein A2275_00685 [Bacteroidetes bacterium RIFOXYA12_FULL_35_11]|nr:MAG: hypothetical protein A2X01_20915 [Bacteroidetes bacterium GWF2_35_48]OFY82075.1 MAG: hypothetical protein A2275_00685 [Bacteroidetes bacterium RIFOXYA12_FULL_35_11]HBX51385.1 hypothetical protein [Bacteroidales bacterium]
MWLINILMKKIAIAYISLLFCFPAFCQTDSTISKADVSQKSIMFKYQNKSEINLPKSNLFSKSLSLRPYVYNTLLKDQYSYYVYDINESLHGVTLGEALFVITTNLFSHGINTAFFKEEYKKDRRPIPYLQDEK